MINIPDISEILVFGPDGGFNTCKASGARVTDLSHHDILSIRARLVTTEFPSYWAPFTKQPGASGRILASPVKMIVGEHAKELQPSLWTTSLGEDHYQGPVWQGFFWAMLYDVIYKSGIKDGAHVKVFTTLGLPHIHMGYAGQLQESLLTDQPHMLSVYNGNTYFVTIAQYHGDKPPLDVQTQPFWIVVDQVFRWGSEGLVSHPELLKGGLAVLDFGSKTTNGIVMVNNLIPVDHISVPIGTWDVVQECVAPAVERLRQERGINVGDVRWQSLMGAYESGEYQIGKHDPLKIADILADYNDGKVQQRLNEVDAKLDGGANIRSVLCAGGDVSVNYTQFADKYERNISGGFSCTTDDDGNIETKYRQRDGLVKGAIKMWAESFEQ